MSRILCLLYIGILLFANSIYAVEATALIGSNPEKDTSKGIWLSHYPSYTIKKISPAATFSAHFSPDGKKVAYVTKSDSLYVMNNDGTDVKFHLARMGIKLVDGESGPMEFAWTTHGIIWIANAKLWRYVPETGVKSEMNIDLTKIRTLCKPLDHYAIYISGDGRRLWFQQAYADCNAGGGRGMHPYIIFNDDYSNATVGWHPDWGHGRTMPLNGDYMAFIELGGMHRHINLIDFKTQTLVYGKDSYENYGPFPRINPPIPSHLQAGFWVPRCANNDSILGAQIRDCRDADGLRCSTTTTMTYFYNWRTPTPTLLGDFRSPVGNPWIGTYEFWVGPLPSAVGDKPFINVEPTTGLTFFVPKSGNPANQTATITNSNPNIKLGTLSTAISPSTVTWLTVTPSGTGETRTLTHMIDGTKVTDGTTIAKVTVSGSNAANTVEYTVTVNKGDGPPAPSNLGASVTGDSLLDVALSWTDNSSNEAGFIIDRRRDEQSSWTEIKRVSANVKTYTDLHIPTGTYFYRVRAYTSTMQSMYSNEVRADVLGIQWIRISRPFSGLTVKPGAIDTIFWTANRVGQVRILLTTNNGATWEQINGITSISTSSPTWGKYPWKVPNVISDEVMIQVIEYQEKVEATTEPFSISNTNSAVIPGQGRLLNHSWIITNSSNGDILVRGTNTGTSSNIVISRLNGTTVYTSKISKGNTLVIPQSRLAKGTYIVHIESGNSVTVKRLITPALER